MLQNREYRVPLLMLAGLKLSFLLKQLELRKINGK